MPDSGVIQLPRPPRVAPRDRRSDTVSGLGRSSRGPVDGSLLIPCIHFAFFVGTRVEKETNKLLFILQFEYGIVTSSILLHLSLSHPNFAISLYKGVNDFAFFVGT